LTWRYKAHAPELVPNGDEDPVAGGFAGGASVGTLTWELDGVKSFEESAALSSDLDLDSPAAPITFERDYGDRRFQDSTVTVFDFLSAQQEVFAKVLQLPMQRFESLFQYAPEPWCLLVLPLTPRADRASFLLGLPPESYVKRWRRDSRSSAAPKAKAAPAPAEPQSRGTREMLSLPLKRGLHTACADPGCQGSSGTKTSLDPLRIVNAISFTRWLRQVDTFKDALEDGRMYEEDDFVGDNPRDATRDPATSSLFRGQRRLDIVGMNIERRLWAQEVEDDLVEAINCYSDSSPVVGTELQGMVADVIRKDKTMRRVWLPGGSIFYGLQDAVNKTMCFVWAAWLVFGPSLKYMQYFCSHVACWTTDFGVERHSVEIPDCLEAFFAWIGGRALEDCARLVNFSRRLFFRSLRIGGWNHGFSNIMLRIAKLYKWWPEVLDHIRNVCRFFRNHTWRDWLRKAWRGKVPHVDTLLGHFTAGTAKWRFATIIECLTQLSPLRKVCQTEMREELFQNAQEKAFIADVLKACRDIRLWLFVDLVGPLVMGKLEHCRRWGLICSDAACNQKRSEGAKHVECPRNGRRLKEAWPWLLERIEELTVASRTITAEECEGDVEWVDLVRSMCSRAASEIRSTWKYLGQVPWALARADSVEGALECMTQIRKQPLELHDPFTRDFVQRVGNDLEARSQGGDLTPALGSAVAFVKHSNLNETCGESYHRWTNHEKVRAPNASTVHMKQKVRSNNVIKTLRTFMRVHGEMGKAIVRYEWKCYKRILQSRRRYRWRGKGLGVKALMARVYREDAMANDNWSVILNRVPLDRPADSHDANAREKMENEYLNCVLHPSGHYCVQQPSAGPANVDEPAPEAHKEFFTVIDIASASRRRHTMHTVTTADEPQHTEPFAMEVQLMDTWTPDDVAEPGPDQARLYATSDPEWLVPARLATFMDFATRLTRYDRERPDPTSTACVLWEDPHKVQPAVPITDEHYPTVCLITHLKAKGYYSVSKTVEHTKPLAAGETGPYDGRECLKQKWYYQVLLRLPSCLPLCGGSLPSQEPVAFYKLLLRGEKAVPGKPSKEYVRQFNALKGLTKKEILPLDDVDLTSLVPSRPGSSFFVPLAGGELPKKKARQATPGSGGGGAGKRHGGDSDPTPAPLPPVGPDLGGDVGGAPGHGGDSVPGPGGVGGSGSGGAGSSGDGAGAGGAAGCGEDGSFFAPPEAKQKNPLPPKVDSLDGLKIRYHVYPNPTGKLEPHWILYCNNPDHGGACEKRKGATPRNEAVFGEIEPVAYLHAWHAIEWPTDPKKATHAQENPTKAQVREIAERRGAELAEVCRRAGR